MSTVLITMAGFGRRFLDAGYTVPKYRIEVHGRTLFNWSVTSLRSFIGPGAQFVFVVRAADRARDFIVAECTRLGIADPAVVELDAPTDGQATTALLAAPVVSDRAAPLLIYNIDTFVHPSALPAEAVRGDGWIPCFKAAGDHWSFARADADGRVDLVREKLRISDHATIGLYGFSSFELYEQVYRHYYSVAAHLEKGERYVAPLYNELITRGLPVFIHDVPLSAVVPLGVPEDVEAFRRATPPAL